MPVFYRCLVTWVLSLIVFPALAAAQSTSTSKLSAADAFTMCEGLLGHSRIVSEEQFHEIEALLRKEGFSQTARFTWRYKDSSGTVVVSGFPEGGTFFVQLIPAVAAPLGDAALAALINKALAVNVQSGDSLELLLTSQTSENQGYRVEVTEYLRFSLKGGAWLRT